MAGRRQKPASAGRPVDEVVAEIAADADLSVGSERSREEFLQTYERLEAEL